ncbi:MAG TPA: fumarate hydratase, partial [Thermoanaerobaculia bacterium]|nr:fumarate hydratase [Thermoanaerobaculia bacterium]
MPAKKTAPKTSVKNVFAYSKPFQRGEDTTSYRLVSKRFVKKARFGGKPVLVVDPAALSLLAYEAMRDVSFLLRPKHQQQVAAILKDPEASPNDRFMATALLRNAVVSAQFELPFCQDTGTATIVAWKGQ